MNYLTLLLCLLGQLAFAGKPSPTPLAPWNIYYFGVGYNYTPFSAVGLGGIVSFAFHHYDTSQPYYMAGCLSTTTDTAVLGDLRNKAIIVTGAVTTNGTPNFVFGGEVTGWNTGPNPPSYRVFISTSSATFTINNSTKTESVTWWVQGSVSLDMLTGVPSYTLTVPAGSLWSNGLGHLSTDPAYSAAFQYALSHVKQAGIMFAGGSFFDVGVSILGPGEATFTLLDFTVYP